nr:lantibiotic dehydratase family protein [Algibacter lectus]
MGKVDENTILAEIDHLPKFREGNVLLRPSFTSYEIPILTHSLKPKEKQIQLKDLYLSVRGNKLMLRSKKLNKYIIPKLSSSHNYLNPQNLSLYRFLSDFQYQNTTRYIFFDWGSIGEDFIFLPRVVYKNTILSKAIWNLTDVDLKELYLHNTDDNLKEKIYRWRKKFKVPKQFVLKEFDNKLFINTENTFLFKMFLSSVKGLKKIVLEETLINNTSLIVKDEDSKYYTNEIIINFYKGNE